MFASTAKPAALAALLLSGCAAQNAPTILADSRPATAPVASSTSLRGALQCLDDLMVRRAGDTTDLLIGYMPDTTGKLNLSLRDMTIHAITTANTRSGAFRVIDKPDLVPVEYNAGGSPPKDVDVSRVAFDSYNLTGSIVAASQALYNEDFSLGLGTDSSPGGSGGISVIGQLGSVSTGMRLSRRGTNETLYSSQHDIVIRRSEVGFDARVGFSGYGASAGISFQRDESSAKAVQTLVELQVLELLGKAAGVPYWECLSRPSGNHATVVAAQKSWPADDGAARTAAMAKGLASLGYTQPFEQALLKFQVDNGLNPTGRIGYESYLTMQEALANAEQVARVQPAALADPQSNITARAKTVAGNWRLEVGLKRGAFVQCYYQADDGVIARIYPNRFDQAVWLGANATHFVPSTSNEDRYAIQAANPQFLCFSSSDDPSRALPQELQQPDFADLRGVGTTSLQDLANAYAAALPDVTIAQAPQY